MSESSDVIYLDLSKAFDKVPHKELLFKLWRLGITGNLWKWFKYYLTNRYHYVCLEGANSTMLPVLSGVPQGSILGPMLFIIYIDDITTYINKSSVFIFADDTKLVKRVSSQEDLSDLQIDLENLLSWCKEWNLTLNTSKCRHMHFGPNYHSHTYSLGNTPILSTESYKDLGITVHKSLSWSPHVNEICKKAYSSLHLIIEDQLNHTTTPLQKENSMYH